MVSLSCIDYGLERLEVESWDVSSAFLQGFSFNELQQVCRELGVQPPEISREVFITVPENVYFHLRKLGVKNSQGASNATTVLHLKKGMYGLSDAPLLWQLCLRRYIL